MKEGGNSKKFTFPFMAKPCLANIRNLIRFSDNMIPSEFAPMLLKHS